ncbi:hypothetical protein BJY01DRAFT_240199 [Aspergillus pseudoustus]|uniref:Metallo-beta-lactamase domain-containing protein n=1 Tax=Aspergillus pseudoustus TaxID=1810923 RepID=A0ABR4ITE2_9EURO
MGSTKWTPSIPSGATVEVSVIDTTTYLTKLDGALVVDPVYPGYEVMKIPSFSFLIHHLPSSSRVLFDLGLRKNWRTHLSPHLLREITALPFNINCEKDVADILTENGVSPDSINAVVFSHHHWDHVGDTTRFPSTTRLVTGPGYKEKYLPGWPADPKAVETTSDLYQGRETVEIDFEAGASSSSCLAIEGCQAYDYFGDGSFYLLNATGHTTGHLNALVRTTTAEAPEGDTFLLLGGDTAHHCSVLRPSVYCPFPATFSPAPGNDDLNSSCPSKRYTSIHRASNQSSSTAATVTSFCKLPEFNPYDEEIAVAKQTLDKIVPLDGADNILTVFAHDDSLMDVIDFFPKTANNWKTDGWKRQGHWRFLAPLKVDE